MRWETAIFSNGEYLRLVKEIAASQGRITNVYYRFLTRYLSRHVTAVLYLMRVKPNTVTWSMMYFGMLGSCLYSLGTLGGYVIGSVCFIMLNIADTSDGELARLRQQTSSFGEYLDRLCHYFTNSMMSLGLGIGLYVESSDLLYIYISCIGCCCYVLDDASKDLLLILKKNGSQTRSEFSQTVSLSKNSTVLTTVMYIFAHSSVWHVLPILALVDILFSGFEFGGYSVSFIYIVLFLLGLPVKAVLRMRNVSKIYGS